MNLRNKILITFGGTVLASIAIIGTIAYNSCEKVSIENVNQGISTASHLAANEIAGEIEEYMLMAEASTTDQVFESRSTSGQKVNRVSELAELYHFTSGNILDKNGISMKDQTDFSDREYVQRALAGETNISEITLSKYTNTYGFSVAAPVYRMDQSVAGVIYYRLDIDFMQKILNSIDISENGYAFLVDKDGTVIVHKDESMINSFNLKQEGESMAALAEQIASNDSGVTEYSYHDVLHICGYAKLEGCNGWTLIVTAPKTDFTGTLSKQMTKLAIWDFIILIVALIIALNFSSFIGGTAKNVKEVLEKIANGDFSFKIDPKAQKDELGVLHNTACDLQRTFSNIITETNTILGSMANYDLAVQDMKSYPGEFDKLSCSINQIKEILRKMIAEVQESASAVGTGSGQLASAADALSQGTVAQASSIDKVVVDIQEMSSKIENNSQNETIVEKKLQDLDSLIGNGNQEMTRLLKVVKEVADMSSDIQKIVGTIDSIAFQTNILALNASVEAARAGENGKGFAVVADEVGNLAAKTSEASKQTSDLIGKCINGIENAMRSADVTFDCLTQVVSRSSEISTAFEEIATDTREQAVKSTHISQEMNIIADVVQNNTATAEESAAATQELSALATNLSILMQKFAV